MNDSAFPDALSPQYKLHWYVLERVLGQGGFGITYLAQDSNLDKLVAIKEYLPVDTATRRADSTVSPRSQTQSERYNSGLDSFIREARTLARFNHPNIVRVHSVFQHNNTAYMVMEFEEGETLAALLERRQTLSEREILNVVLPVLDGLALVHAAGFIHRDIKPENIMIRPDASPVLLDFGSARAAMGQSRTVTILVAPGYAPYEQYYANGDSQGSWTDIYSLGATCYCAIAGEAPMDAISRSKGVLGSTREMLVPASERGTRRYSPQFLLAIDHALAFSERDRPQTLDQWRLELTGVAAATGVGAAPAAAPPVLAAAGAGRAGASSREVVAWAGLGAALTGLAFLLWPRPQMHETEPRAVNERAAAGLSGAPEATKASAAVNPSPLVLTPAPPASAAAAAPVLQKVEEVHKEEPPQPVKSVKALPPVPLGNRTALRTSPMPTAAPPALRVPAPAATTVAAAAPTPVAVPTPAPAAAPTTVAVPTPAPAAAPTAVAVTAPAPATATAPTPAPAAAPAPAATTVASVAPATTGTTAAVAAAARTAAPTDDAEAYAFYRARALKGDADARFRLGEMFAAGKGVTQNSYQSYVWFGLAARSGNALARSRQAQVAQRLQPAELRQADRLIEQLKGTE